MSGIDPSCVARELVEQKKLEGSTNLYDGFHVIRETYDVSDVELIQVIRELRNVHGVHFDKYQEPGMDWVISMPTVLS